jgi:hypothetical protein
VGHGAYSGAGKSEPVGIGAGGELPPVEGTQREDSHRPDPGSDDAASIGNIG